MNENLIKPVSVARQEFIDQLIDNINNCQLPMFVIEPILQDMLNTVRAAAQKQYEAEKAQYEAQLKNQKEQSK